MELDREKMRRFLEDIKKLEEEYQLYLIADCEEHYDMGIDGEPQVYMQKAVLLIVDKEGNEIRVEELESD